jgi:hypothetical protein
LVFRAGGLKRGIQEEGCQNDEQANIG